MSAMGAFVLGLVGAGLLIWMGLQSIKAGSSKGQLGMVELMNTTTSKQKKELPSFAKGILTHLTSPYPYLYWGTVGSSFVREGFKQDGAWGAALFPLGFWTGTTTFTLLTIYLVTRGKKFMPPHWEPYLHHFSGALLVASAIFLVVKVWRGFI
jgi:threonine/homoserine/homoserine lactone efflux protein